MPLSRSQPSPERQTALSFVSPSVADLLFYETVDAKTVGAGSGKTITAISSAEQAVSVASGYREEGFNVTVTCNGHGYAVGDVVTIVNAPTGSNGLNANGTYGIRSKTTNNFVYFVRGTLTGGDDTSTFTLTGLNPHVYKSHPQYGAAHPDTEKFPNHTLCYVKQADGEGLYFEYYYAAERHFQDDYNFEVTAKELAGQKFNAVKRTYLTLRADWDEDAPAMGSAMPRNPDTRFPAGYVLVGREQKRIGDSELDSLYVVEVRTYAAFFDADQEDFNYELTATEIAGQKFNAVKRTYVALRSSWSESSPAMGSTMSRTPGTKFSTDYVLVKREQKQIGIPELDSLYVIEVRTYARFFDVNQDSYNYSFSQADLGGNKYDTVVRTYVLLRSAFDDTASSHEAGDAMPDAAGLFNDDYILLTRQQKEIGTPELDTLYVMEQRVYFKRVDIVTHNMDPATEKVLATVEKVVYRGETFDPPNDSAAAIQTITEQADDSDWGLDGYGRNWEVAQLSNDWWKVTIQDVIPQTGLSDLYGGKVIREYDTWQNFTWPSVVDGLVFTSAARKDGASQTAVTVRMKQGKQGFSGPTKMTVKQIWSKTKFTGSNFPDPTVFKPTSARYSGVQYSVSVSNVLTPAITLIDFIGTEHPTYKMGEYAFPKPWCLASDPTDWPASAFVGATTQKPFRGGYLMEVVTVHPPS